MTQSPAHPLLAAVLVAVTLGSASAVHAEGLGSTYQIVKATESRVWRLNTHTGEIAVCSLQGEQLLCTSSAQAITPPAKSYAELQAEREAQALRDAERKQEKRERNLAMLTLMFNAFKDLAMAGSEADAR